MIRLYANAVRFARSLIKSWKNARQRRAGLDELAWCGNVEMSRIAADLNLSCAELKDLAGREPASADLLYRRMAALGIDRAAIDKTLERDMQRICSCCGSKTKCVEDLKDELKPAQWPRYCPNATTLATLTARH